MGWISREISSWSLAEWRSWEVRSLVPHQKKMWSRVDKQPQAVIYHTEAALYDGHPHPRQLTRCLREGL